MLKHNKTITDAKDSLNETRR